MAIYEFNSEAEAIRVLKSEGKRLEEIAKKVWRQYLDSYQPKQYVRTHDSERAIKLGSIHKIDEDTLGIRLEFQDDLTYHNSVITKGKPRGHSFMLISEGWKVKKGKHRDVKRFGYYEGFNYIGKIIEAFNNGKHQGITLEVQWAGERFRKQDRQRNVLR